MSCLLLYTYFTLHCMHREAGQYSEALAAATQALDAAGEAGAAVLEALREVGACHQQLNNHTAALQAYSEALNRSTSDDHALLLLVGNAQRLTGQPYDAIATYCSMRVATDAVLREHSCTEY
eukprot:962-Heterococcus_DN1.PRE.2